MMKSKFTIILVIALILTACILITGCTSTQNTQDQTQTPPPTTATISEPITTTLSQATSSVSTVTTAIPTTVAHITTQPPTEGFINVTINSAEKKTAIGGISPQSGSVFLVLDVTLKNNDKNDDFEYTNTTFQILANNQGAAWHTPLAKKFRSGLDNQLTSGTIPLKSEISGQIVFGVSSTLKSYSFAVFDSSGSEITRVENITVP